MSVEWNSGEVTDPWRDDDQRRSRPRARFVLMIALAPWALLLGLALRGQLPPTAAPLNGVAAVPSAPTPVAPTSTAPSPASTTTPAAAPTLDQPASRPSGAPYAIRFGSRRLPGPSDAAAVASVVARAWLEGVGPSLDVDVGSAATDMYVDHLAVESVDLPAPGAAIVSVLAITLTVEDDRYTAAQAVRVAVPVRLDARGARPAGSPWWLSPPDLAVDAPQWSVVADATLLADAGAALEAAGYREVDVTGLERSDGWPLRVAASAVAPGATQVREHQVWLRADRGRLLVAGQLPDPPAEVAP